MYALGLIVLFKGVISRPEPIYYASITQKIIGGKFCENNAGIVGSLQVQ